MVSGSDQLRRALATGMPEVAFLSLQRASLRMHREVSWQEGKVVHAFSNEILGGLRGGHKQVGQEGERRAASAAGKDRREGWRKFKWATTDKRVGSLSTQASGEIGIMSARVACSTTDAAPTLKFVGRRFAATRTDKYAAAVDL